MFIRTRRLFLRPPFPEDWSEVFHGLCDERIVRMLASAPWPYEPGHAQEYCARPADPHDHRFAITLPGETGAPVIGQIGFRLAGESWEVGYWIARDFQGHGYASEALAGVLECARALRIARMEAGHYLDNPASGCVLSKCGFARTGEIRPSHSLGRGGEMVLARRYAIDLVSMKEAETGPAQAA